MIVLLTGLLLWTVVHLAKSVARGVRGSLVARLGEDPYRGLASIVLLGSVALMVLGWRSISPTAVYAPPPWGRAVTLGGVLIGIFLLAVSVKPNFISTRMRHPQLTGVAVWAAAHLVSNGDQRSLVLFGGLGLWAVLNMVTINARDGAWIRPAPEPLSTLIAPAAMTAVAFAALGFAHPWLAGKPLW